MMPLVSFVIPVYKVEHYLDQCVSSIVDQTYKDLEIILVDDGSPDHCPQMCDEWAKKDARIKVVHKSNGGLSDARNVGIDQSSGEYIVFIDSDDFWSSENDLTDLMALFDNNNLDFLCFNFSYYFGREIARPYQPFDNKLLSPIDGNMTLIYTVCSGDLPMSACNKVIRTSFIKNNNLYFQKGILAEDIPWFINVLEKTEKCVFVNKYVYNYRQNVPTSITTSGGIRSFNNLFEIIKSEIDILSTRSFTEDAKRCLLSFLAYEYCILLLITESFSVTLRRYSFNQLKEYKWLMDYPQNPKVRIASKCYHLCGLKLTSKVLFIYRKLQNFRKG